MTSDARSGTICVADHYVGVTPAQAAVATDAVMTAYHAIIRRGQIKKDETVFLFGLGGLGFNALQVVHNVVGARVIVSDIRQERLDAVAELGIPKDDIVPVGKSVQEFVTETGLNNKIDATLDFVGEKQTFEDAQEIGERNFTDDPQYISTDATMLNPVRTAGRMVCVGTLSAENIMNMKRGIRKRLTVIFSYGGQREDLEELLDLMGKGVIMPQTEEGKLEDFPGWLRDLCDGKIRARVALQSS
jgi:propanol-preferring alcohol dehydrogenase